MSFLTRTYPFKQSKHLLRDSIIYGFIVWLILYFLQPFGFCMYQGNKCLAASLFGLVTLGCHATYAATILKYFHQNIKPWRIWHEGLAILGLIFIIAIGNFLLFSYLFHYSITPKLFLLFLNWTMIIGVIMTILSIGMQYNRTLRERMEDLLRNTTKEQEDVSIMIHDTSVRGNDLSIPINDLLYIEAQKNNISVCFLKEGNTVSVDIHTTLSHALEELKEFENIFQCHRSFAVNVNNITSARGNSNGYQLTLGNCKDIIPVSRSFVPKFKTFLT